MRYKRLRICEDISAKLSRLKGRTGLTPNILCRIGFSLSLNDPTPTSLDDYPTDVEKEIERHVLTGEWDMMFEALIRERCKMDNLSLEDEDVFSQFKAHTYRGVDLLHKRVRCLNDLDLLLL